MSYSSTAKTRSDKRAYMENSTRRTNDSDYIPAKQFINAIGQPYSRKLKPLVLGNSETSSLTIVGPNYPPESNYTYDERNDSDHVELTFPIIYTGLGTLEFQNRVRIPVIDKDCVVTGNLKVNGDLVVDGNGGGGGGPLDPNPTFTTLTVTGTSTLAHVDGTTATFTGDVIADDFTTVGTTRTDDVIATGHIQTFSLGVDQNATIVGTTTTANLTATGTTNLAGATLSAPINGTTATMTGLVQGGSGRFTGDLEVEGTINTNAINGNDDGGVAITSNLQSILLTTGGGVLRVGTAGVGIRLSADSGSLDLNAIDEDTNINIGRVGSSAGVVTNIHHASLHSVTQDASLFCNQGYNNTTPRVTSGGVDCSLSKKDCFFQRFGNCIYFNLQIKANTPPGAWADTARIWIYPGFPNELRLVHNMSFPCTHVRKFSMDRVTDQLELYSPGSTADQWELNVYSPGTDHYDYLRARNCLQNFEFIVSGCLMVDNDHWSP